MSVGCLHGLSCHEARQTFRQPRCGAGIPRRPGERIRAEGDAPKIYLVHAPEVSCIAKGNAHRKYEFGNKVSVASTSKESFVVGMKSLPANPFDGHTLKSAIDQIQMLSGVTPKEAYVDRGYTGHGLSVPGVDGLSFKILDRGGAIAAPLGVPGLSGAARLQLPNSAAASYAATITFDVMEFIKSR